MKYAILVLILAQSLFSVQLTPITQRIDSPKSRNLTFTVKNIDKDMAAAECSILKVVGHDENGVEIREETDDVVIYPSQFVLQEQESKGVRVNYTKSTLPQKEAVYRVLATQLALNLKEESKGSKVKGAMKFIFSYEGLLFVGAKEEKPNITSTLENVSKSNISIKMHNNGVASHFIHVNHFDFTIETATTSIKLTEKDFGKFGGIRLLPDESFVVTLDKNEQLQGKTLKSITITPKTN